MVRVKVTVRREHEVDELIVKWMAPVCRLPRPFLSPAELRHRRSLYHPLLHAPPLDEAEEDATCRSRKHAGSQGVLMASSKLRGWASEWFVGECALVLVEESLASAVFDLGMM